MPQIKNIQTTNEMIVTDHAVIRYIERAMGIDAAAIRQGIADECKRWNHGINGRFPIMDGHYYAAIEDGRVLSVLPKRRYKKKKKAKPIKEPTNHDLLEDMLYKEDLAACDPKTA